MPASISVWPELWPMCGALCFFHVSMSSCPCLHTPVSRGLGQSTNLSAPWPASLEACAAHPWTTHTKMRQLWKEEAQSRPCFPSNPRRCLWAEDYMLSFTQGSVLICTKSGQHKLTGKGPLPLSCVGWRRAQGNNGSPLDLSLLGYGASLMKEARDAVSYYHCAHPALGRSHRGWATVNPFFVEEIKSVLFGKSAVWFVPSADPCLPLPHVPFLPQYPALVFSTPHHSFIHI